MANIRVARRSGLVLRGGSQRRETLWIGIVPSSNTLAAAGTAVLSHALNAAALALRPFTVVRSRLEWKVDSDQSGASEAYMCHIGVSIVSDQAVAVGVTAVPTPSTDVQSDMFLLYGLWMGTFQLVGTSIMSEVDSKTLDSKAMRKVEDGQDLIITQEAGPIDSGLNVRVGGRFLVKLH